MIAYSDTSFLCALYRGQDNTPEAIAHARRMPEPLHVSSLLLFEFRQSIRCQEFLHKKDPLKGFNRTTGLGALAKVQANISSGAVAVVAADWNDVHQIAERLSAQHTHTGVHRGFDIMHVATALHFGAKEFLSFDLNQKKLAKAEGLKIPL
jgi:predicted nucleic acid-binding protein